MIVSLISEPARQTECVGAYDVVVCGGGVGGIASALAAARHGAKTLLVDRGFLLGGLATAGLIAIYLPLCDGKGRQVSFGIAEELLRFSVRRGMDVEQPELIHWMETGNRDHTAKLRYRAQYNPQVFGMDVENLLEDAGVEILYGVHVCGVAQEDGRITHVIFEGKSGRQAVAAKSVIDCTGDGDIVHLAGENEAKFGQGNVLAGWYYRIHEGRYELHVVGAADVPDNEKVLRHPKNIIDRRFSGLDTKELSEQVLLSHWATMEDFFKGGDVTPDHTITTVSTIPQVRMTRRLDGISTLQTADVHREFADSVGLFSDWRRSGPVYEMRLSALHGKRVPNLYCAGRNISSADDMWDITRVIQVCAVSGEAAGLAAALGEDYDVIARELRADGVKLHESELE